MADQGRQNQQPSGQRPEPSSARPEPKIRTMKSDIDKFMKDTKPSLIQMMTKQAEYRSPEIEKEEKKFPTKIILIVAGSMVVLAVLGWLGYILLTPQTPPQQAKTSAGKTTTGEEIPASPILTEKTQTATSLRNPIQLQKIIFDAAQNAERPQSLKRLVIKIKEADGGTGFLTAKDFFDILNIPAPQQVQDTLRDQLFLYIYYTSTGLPRAIFIAPSRNPERMRGGMFAWESSMERDLDTLFLGATPNQIVAPFFDKTFRNIDYRTLALEPGTEVGYFMFSAKNFLVITTSDEALQVAINRLFESR
ncbi:MAG: hypothetical protein Q7R91_01545 [bacterium]|nr:hypothetical protein [bacterium]